MMARSKMITFVAIAASSVIVFWCFTYDTLPYDLSGITRDRLRTIQMWVQVLNKQGTIDVIENVDDLFVKVSEILGLTPAEMKITFDGWGHKFNIIKQHKGSKLYLLVYSNGKNQQDDHAQVDDISVGLECEPSRAKMKTAP